MILFSKCTAFGCPVVLFQGHEFKTKGATLTHTYTSNANVRSRIPAQVLAHIRGTCISYVRIGSLQERVIFVYISHEYVRHSVSGSANKFEAVSGSLIMPPIVWDSFCVLPTVRLQ